MSVFFILVGKIAPLYLLILLGFLAGRYAHVSKEKLSFLLLYIIAPVIFFNGVYTTPITFALLSLPVLFFFLCSFLCLSFLFISKFIWKDTTTRNIYAFMTGESNVGYFGLPVIAALFGNNLVGTAVLCTLGFSFYESSVGFFVAARGKHSVFQSLKKLLILPTIYALILGLVANVIHIHFGPVYDNIVSIFKLAFTVFGMMLVGLAVSNFTSWKIDVGFVSMGFLSKFIVWPLLMLGVIYMDTQFFHFYTASIHHVIFLMSIVPIAASTVVFAMVLKAHPEKVSVAVLSTTLFALVYIPLVVSLFIH